METATTLIQPVMEKHAIYMNLDNGRSDLIIHCLMYIFVCDPKLTVALPERFGQQFTLFTMAFPHDLNEGQTVVLVLHSSCQYCPGNAIFC